jgi:hypothetical protein
MRTLNLFLLFFFLFALNSYSLPQCVGDDFTKWNICYGTYTSASGAKYEKTFNFNFENKINAAFNSFAGQYKADGSSTSFSMMQGYDVVLFMERYKDKLYAEYEAKVNSGIAEDDLNNSLNKNYFWDLKKRDDFFSKKDLNKIRSDGRDRDRKIKSDKEKLKIEKGIKRLDGETPAEYLERTSKD